MSFQRPGQSGSTLPELLIAVAIVGLICGFVVYRTESTAGILKAGTDQLAGRIRLVRSEAMATTTPHRLVPDGTGALAVQSGGPCGDPAATWTERPELRLELDDALELASTAWSACFTTRGWTGDVHEIRLLNGDDYQNVVLLLGGSTRIEPVVRTP